MRTALACLVLLSACGLEPVGQPAPVPATTQQPSVDPTQTECTPGAMPWRIYCIEGNAYFCQQSTLRYMATGKDSRGEMPYHLPDGGSGLCGTE